MTHHAVHVIPVPRGMTAEEAWEEIRLLGCLTTEHAHGPCAWAVIHVEEDDAEEAG